MSLFNSFSRSARASRLNPAAAAPTMLEALESRRLYSVSTVALHSPTIPLPPPVSTHVVSGVSKLTGAADDDGSYCLTPYKLPIGPGPGAIQVFAQ